MKMETVLYKALVASNVPDVHATAVIEAMEKEMTSVLASKTDVITLRTEVKADIAVLRSEVKTDISALRTEFSGLRTELKTDISELQKSIVKLDAKVEILGKNLTIRLLLIIGAAAGASSGLVTSGLKYLA